MFPANAHTSYLTPVGQCQDTEQRSRELEKDMHAACLMFCCSSEPFFRLRYVFKKLLRIGPRNTCTSCTLQATALHMRNEWTFAFISGHCVAQCTEWSILRPFAWTHSVWRFHGIDCRDVSPCSHVDVCEYFGGTRCVQLWGRTANQIRNQEDAGVSLSLRLPSQGSLLALLLDA
jgi:hypothetical protein